MVAGNTAPSVRCGDGSRGRDKSGCRWFTGVTNTPRRKPIRCADMPGEEICRNSRGRLALADNHSPVGEVGPVDGSGTPAYRGRAVLSRERVGTRRLAFFLVYTKPTAPARRRRSPRTGCAAIGPSGRDTWFFERRGGAISATGARRNRAVTRSDLRNRMVSSLGDSRNRAARPRTRHLRYSICGTVRPTRVLPKTARVTRSATTMAM